MNITLHSVIPYPLENSVKPNGFWGSDFTFQRGGNYLISAESGRGKSTLIHIIHGSRRDYHGKVLYGEQDLKEISSKQLSVIRSQEFSFVFQDLRVFPQLTVMENIRILQQIQPIEQFEKKSLELLGRLEIAELSERKGQQLSYGQRQRVAIARALISKFQWLVLDEPFAHLDMGNSMRALQLIQEVCDEKNASFILSSHQAELPVSIQHNILI